MNSKHRKTLEAIFSDPVNGGLEWARGVVCRSGLRGSGSSVTFEKGGKHAHFHRPHPERESLRYRVRAAREYLTTLGIKP